MSHFVQHQTSSSTRFNTSLAASSPSLLVASVPSLDPAIECRVHLRPAPNRRSTRVRKACSFDVLGLEDGGKCGSCIHVHLVAYCLEIILLARLLNLDEI